MTPGRELDALIAEKVMGLKPCSDPIGRCDSAHTIPIQCWGEGGGGSELKSYSADIAAAWEVVEHVRLKLGFPGFSFHAADGFEVEFSRLDGKFLQNEDTIFMGRADTAPHAICLAALKAVNT